MTRAAGTAFTTAGLPRRRSARYGRSPDRNPPARSAPARLVQPRCVTGVAAAFQPDPISILHGIRQRRPDASAPQSRIRHGRAETGNVLIG